MPDQELETRIVTLQMQAESGDLNAAAAAVGQVLDRLDDLDKKTKQWEKETEKVRKKYESMLPQVNKISRGIDAIHGAAQKAASAIGTIGDALGAGGISIAFAQGTKTVIEYNKQLIGLSAQYAKYGRGISEVETKMLGLGKKLSLTRNEVMGLYKTLEKGLPNASLAATEKILTNIRKVVGSNEQAISEMAGNLLGLLNTYPSLQKAAEDMSELDKRRLDNIVKMELAAGRMSLQQAKALQDYTAGNKQMSKADGERLKKSKEMVRMQQDMKKLYEEILFKIGGAILPVVQSLARVIEENKEHILKAAEFFGKWIAPLLLAKSLIGNMVGAIGSVTKGVGGLFSGIKGVAGKAGGNKVFVTNWPASMKASGMKGGGFGAAGMLKLGMAGIAGYHGGGALGRGIGKQMGLGKRGMETADDLGSIAGAGLAGGMVAGPLGAAVAAAAAGVWKFAKILGKFNAANNKITDAADKAATDQVAIAKKRWSLGEIDAKQRDQIIKRVQGTRKRTKQQEDRAYASRTSLVDDYLPDFVKNMNAKMNSQAAGLLGSMASGLGMDKTARSLQRKSDAWKNRGKPIVSKVPKATQDEEMKTQRMRQKMMVQSMTIDREYAQRRMVGGPGGLAGRRRLEAASGKADVDVKKMATAFAGEFGKKGAKGMGADELFAAIKAKAAGEGHKMEDLSVDDKRQYGKAVIQEQLGVKGAKAGDADSQMKIAGYYDKILASMNQKLLLDRQILQKGQETAAMINRTRILHDSIAAQIGSEVGLMDALIEKIATVGGTQAENNAVIKQTEAIRKGINAQIVTAVTLRKQAEAALKDSPNTLKQLHTTQQQITDGIKKEQKEREKIKEQLAGIAKKAAGGAKTETELNNLADKRNSLSGRLEALSISIADKKRQSIEAQNGINGLTAAEARTRADIAEKTSEITKLEQQRAKLIEVELRKQQMIAQVQSGLTSATMGQLQAQAEVLQMRGMTSGGERETMKMVTETVIQLEAEAKAYGQVAAKARAALVEARKGTTTKQQVKRLLEEERKALTNVAQASLKVRQAKQANIDAYKEEVSLKEKAASITEAEIGIMDNYMMGVKASAQLRLKLASDYASQEQSLMKQIKAARIEVAASAGQANQVYFQKKLMDLEKQRLGVIGKMASVTKVLRDGWVGAINAMTVGSGRISKIVMTQTKNTGLMVKHLNIMRTGKSGAMRRGGEKGMVGRGGGAKFGTDMNTFVDSKGGEVSDFGGSAYKLDRGLGDARQMYELGQRKHAAGLFGDKFSGDVRKRTAGLSGKGEMLGAAGQASRLGAHMRVGGGGGVEKGLTPGRGIEEIPIPGGPRGPTGSLGPTMDNKFGGDSLLSKLSDLIDIRSQPKQVDVGVDVKVKQVGDKTFTISLGEGKNIFHDKGGSGRGTMNRPVKSNK